MAEKKKAAPPGEPVSEAELKRTARAVLEQRRAIKAAELVRAAKAQFKKPKLAPGKDQLDALLDQLRGDARQGDIFRWQKGTSEFFFAASPTETLEREGREFLSATPQTAAALAAHTGLPAPLVSEWIAKAVATQHLFWLPPASGSKVKRLSLEPDRTAQVQAFRRALTTKLKATKAYVATLLASGIPESDLAGWVLNELDLQPPRAPARSEEKEPARVDSESDSQLLLSELQRLSTERRQGALLLVAELRKRVPLNKQRFDQAALALRDKRTIVLHIHDQAGALAAIEREQLVVDARGTHFVGIAVAPQE